MPWSPSAIKLINQAKDCVHCAHELPLGAKPIFKLHPNAKIVLLSQAPGRIAHESGVAWDDPGGRRLREWLSVSDDAFFQAENFAVLPLGLCYPGKGKGGDLPPRPECAPLWQKPLLDLMPKLQMKILIGGYAMRYHLAEQYAGTVTDTLRNWRELSAENYWPLPHPSPRNRAWLSRIPFFEQEILPALQQRISQVIKN